MSESPFEETPELDQTKIDRIAELLPDVIINHLKGENPSPMLIQAAMRFLEKNPKSKIPRTGGNLPPEEKPPFPTESK